MSNQQLPKLEFPDDMPDNLRSLYQQVIDTYQDGQVYAVNRRYDEAIEAYRACLDFAAEQPVPLYISHYFSIQLSIGFAYADQFKYRKALTVYLSLVQTLKREGEWYKQLRDGLTILFPESFLTEVALANLLNSIAITYYQLRETDKALQYFQEASDLSVEVAAYSRAAQLWFHLGQNARVRTDWENMKLAGEKMLAISHAHNLVDETIAASQFIVQYWANQSDLDKTIECLETLTAFERKHNHQMLAKDLPMLGEMRRLKGKGTPLPPPGSASPIIEPQYWQHHIQVAVMVLRGFAEEHGGPQTEGTEDTKHGLAGNKQPTPNVTRWSVGVESFPTISANGMQEAKPTAVLDFHQTPEAIIGVTLETALDFQVLPCTTQKLPTLPEPTLMASKPVIIPATEEILRELLNDWLEKGWIYKEESRLRFKGVPKTGESS